MQPTTYRLSDSYIRKKSKPSIAGPLAFAMVIGLMIGPWGFAKSMHPALGVLIAALAFAYMFYKNLKASRRSAEKLPQMGIEVSADTLRFIESGGMYEVPVSSIKAVAIDRRSNEPRVVYLQRKDEGTINVDDLDRMDQFAKQISQIVGSSKVRELSWWQGPPK